MIKEIGSEFCALPKIGTKQNFLATFKNVAYFDSGRSAISAIIRDILKEKGDFKVYMPSYCCDSMLFPFVKLGIEVVFYEVNLNNQGLEYNFDKENDCQVVFLMDYFGYRNPDIISITKSEKERGKTVIYDATQSLFMDFPNADYVFASFRKWFYSFSALLIKNGAFSAEMPSEVNQEYISLKTEAAEKKVKYLEGKPADKDEFLSLYSEAEEVLERGGEAFSAPKADIDRLLFTDFDSIKAKRRENAQSLINGIGSLSNKIALPFKEPGKDDFPLFVPILVKNGERTALRKAFIEESIYLPVHWPFSQLHKVKNSVYEEELSLICDQRYSKEDMDRITEILKRFYQKR